jgi:hypothetical protein
MNRAVVVSVRAVLMAMVALGGAGIANGASRLQATPTWDPTVVPSDFVQTIDNPYYPQFPGTTLVYEGVKVDEAQRTEITVTTDTKTILGVVCVTVKDRVTAGGEVVQEDTAWYAQDTAGNVWNFGTYATEYEQGHVVGTEGSWEAGVNGAKPGIVMPAAPKVGDVFTQELAPGVANDIAEVLKVDDAASGPAGAFHDVVVTKEWSTLEPDVIEQKRYAPGIGLVLSEVVQGEPERIELVRVEGASGATPSVSANG